MVPFATSASRVFHPPPAFGSAAARIPVKMAPTITAENKHIRRRHISIHITAPNIAAAFHPHTSAPRCQ